MVQFIARLLRHHYLTTIKAYPTRHTAPGVFPQEDSAIGITPQMLEDCVRALHSDHSLPRWDRCMLQAAFTVAFFGLLRASEFTHPSPNPTCFDGSVQLTTRDLSFPQADAIDIRLKGSETDQFRQGTSITFGRTHSRCCPVEAMQHYLKLHRHQRGKAPLFVFESGNLLTRNSLVWHLRRLLQTFRLNPSHYSSHSFQIGGATAAAAAGLPLWQIQELGRWRSQTFRRYTRVPNASLRRISKALDTR